jgi:hypothetical protein
MWSLLLRVQLTVAICNRRVHLREIYTHGTRADVYMHTENSETSLGGPRISDLA